MRVSRLFLDAPLSENLSRHSEVHVSDDRAHYLKNVLRLQQGDVITVFNGSGGEYSAKISTVGKKHLSLELVAFNPENRTPDIKINLGLCVIKRDAMDAAIQKATELGVSNIYPLISERVSVPSKQLKNRSTHWKNIAISACEQCGMNIVPGVHDPQPLETWRQQLQGLKLCALPGGRAFNKSEIVDSVNLLVGPEGGFNDQEIDGVNESGFFGIDLGSRILRAETAVSSLMTLAMLRP